MQEAKYYAISNRCLRGVLRKTEVKQAAAADVLQDEVAVDVVHGYFIQSSNFMLKSSVHLKVARASCLSMNSPDGGEFILLCFTCQ